jgi:hypothetical protein
MDEITPPFKGPFIGVATQSALASPELKRWLLLFDEVVVDDLEIAIRLASSDGEYKAAELEWLAGQGLLRQCKFDELPPLKDSALQRVIDEANGYYAARLARWISLSKPDYDFFGGSPELLSGLRPQSPAEELITPIEEARKSEGKRTLLNAMMKEGSGFDQVKAQSAALRLRASGADAVSVHADPTLERKDHLTDVLSILLPTMPIPEQDTPWERIVDFRSDPGSSDKFVRFRRWATYLSTHPEEIAELNGQLDWMLYDYAKHMEFYKMKTRQSLFEVLVSIPVELILGLPKALLELAKPDFALKKREYELIEADLNAPGKEIAYLYDARQSFH